MTEPGEASLRLAEQSGGAGNRTQVREALNQPSFTCVDAVSPATEFVDSAKTYSALISFIRDTDDLD
jgi:hypothetical protein